MLTRKALRMAMRSPYSGYEHHHALGYLDHSGRPLHPPMFADLSRSSSSKRKGTVATITWRKTRKGIVADCKVTKKVKKMKGKKKTSSKSKQKR